MLQLIVPAMRVSEADQEPLNREEQDLTALTVIDPVVDALVCAGRPETRMPLLYQILPPLVTVGSNCDVVINVQLLNEMFPLLQERIAIRAVTDITSSYAFWLEKIQNLVNGKYVHINNE